MSAVDGSLWPPPRFDERDRQPPAFNESSPKGVLIAVSVTLVTHLAIAALLTVLTMLATDVHVPDSFMID